MPPEGLTSAPQSSDQFYLSPILDEYFLAMPVVELLESIKKKTVEKKTHYRKLNTTRERTLQFHRDSYYRRYFYS